MSTDNAVFSIRTAAEHLLAELLAPDEKCDPDVVRINTTAGIGYSVEFFLRWKIDPRDANQMFNDRAKLLKDMDAFLSKVSRRITYGEVVALRDEVAAKENELGALRQKVNELQRYRDAVELMQGRKLT